MNNILHSSHTLNDSQANLSQLNDLTLRLAFCLLLDTYTITPSHPLVHATKIFTRAQNMICDLRPLTPLYHFQANLSQLNDLTLRLAFCLMIDGQAPLYGLWCSYVQSYLPQGVRSRFERAGRAAGWYRLWCHAVRC